MSEFDLYLRSFIVVFISLLLCYLLFFKMLKIHKSPLKAMLSFSFALFWTIIGFIIGLSTVDQSNSANFIYYTAGLPVILGGKLLYLFYIFFVGPLPGLSALILSSILVTGTLIYVTISFLNKYLLKKL